MKVLKAAFRIKVDKNQLLLATITWKLTYVNDQHHKQVKRFNRKEDLFLRKLLDSEVS